MACFHGHDKGGSVVMGGYLGYLHVMDGEGRLPHLLSIACPKTTPINPRIPTLGLAPH